MNRNSMNRCMVGVVAIALAVAASSCREQSDAPPTSGERVVDSKTAAAIDADLERLIQLSDEATSPVTVTLPDGSTARGRRPKPRVIERSRDPVFPALEDPLAEVARPIELAPDSPLAFDWWPPNPSILLVVDPQGLWRWNVSSRSRSLWISNENIGFRPRQVLANRDGRILLAEPGGAAVLVPADNGPARLLPSPESFRFNYVDWHPDGRLVLGVLEYMNPTSPVGRIHLEAALWDPDSGEMVEYEGPALDDLAWIGSSTALGGWLAHARRDPQIDPCPAPLLFKPSEGGEWKPVLEDGAWTNAALSVAIPSAGAGAATRLEAVAAWIRRERSDTTTGKPWLRLLDPDAPLESLVDAEARDIPLSHRAYRRVVVSADGRFVAASTRQPGQDDNGAFALLVAPVDAAVQQATQSDIDDAEMQRRAAREELWAAFPEEILRPAGGPEDAKALVPFGNLPPQAVELLDRFTSATAGFLGIAPDFSLASLDEIAFAVDYVGGDWVEHEGFLVAAGLYYGEGLRRATEGVWALGPWPPSDIVFDDIPVESDDFMYTIANPFALVRASLIKSQSLRSAAEEILRASTTSLYLADSVEGEATALTIAIHAGEAAQESPSVTDPNGRSPERAWALYLSDIRGEVGAFTEDAWIKAAALARIRPEADGAFAHLGDSLRGDGFMEQALRAYLRASEMNPGRAEWLVGAAQAAFEIGKYDDARDLFLRAQRIDVQGEWKDVIQQALPAVQAAP